MKNYKTIFGFFAGAALVVLVSSCNLNKLPVFDDDDAFASFESASYTVDENAGVLSIPVTVASVKGLSTTVTYSTVDGTATAGVNFELEDASGVLTFSSGERTKYINVKITEITDENCEDYGYSSGFTGNLTFSITLTGATSVNLGMENTCSVTINDLDHPLAGLVGTYDCYGEDYWGPWEWYAEMYTDPDDTSIIWICGLDPYFEDSGYVGDVYGTVTLDDDSNPIQISIALPYWVGAYGSYYICYTTSGGSRTLVAGTLNLDYDEENGCWVTDSFYYVNAYDSSGDFTSYEGFYDYCEAGATYTKIE